MRKVWLDCIDGTTTEYDCYTPFEFNYLQLSRRSTSKRSGKKTENLLDCIATFDIETTTLPGKKKPGKRNGRLKTAAQWIKKPVGFMYHWQFCIDGCVIYGRTWEEYQEHLRKLKSALFLGEERKLVIYVHNLPYEFQFLKDFMEDPDVFAIKPRKPLRVDDKKGFQYRCSYKLTNMSLDAATKKERGVLHRKSAGDLDYTILRTPGTPLTDTEFKYCIADVVSLYELINCRLKNDGDTLHTIPMTSTGYIRRMCRQECRATKGYHEFFLKTRMTPAVYQKLKTAGRGGDTHANRTRAGKIIENVESFDVQSSYPYVLCTKYFPMTAFTPYGEVDSMKEFRELLSEKCVLFTVLFEGLRLKRGSFSAFPYISESKCDNLSKERLLDNGRILRAKHASMQITEIDYELIERQYEWDNISVGDIYTAERGQLPSPLRKVIIQLFQEKSELKYKMERLKEQGKTDTEEYLDIEYLYGKKKNELNGIFGMMYTDPIRDEVIYMEEMDADGSHWKEESPDIEEALEKFYRSRNSFLYYAWGIYTTCQARRHLADLVDIIGQENSFYCDTDSDKGSVQDFSQIEAANERIMEETVKVGAYAEVEGERFIMGIYEHDGAYDEFITLGAKKYCYQKGGDLHVTVSGVNKKAAPRELETIHNFVPGFIFRKAGGQLLTYNDSEIRIIEVNGESFTTASNIAMTDSTYELNITEDYEKILEGVLDYES